MSTSTASSDTPPPARRLPWPVLLSLGAHGVALAVALVLAAGGPPAAGASTPAPMVAAFVEALEPVREDVDVIEDGLESADEPRLLDERVQPPATPDDPSVECELPDACESIEVQRAPLTLPEIPLEAVRSRRPQSEPIPEPTPTPTPSLAAPARAAPVAHAQPSPVRARPARARLTLTHRPDVRRYYPERARRQGIEGTTIVRIDVDARGLVTSALVARSSGSELLDRHALRFARDLRFAPGAAGAALQPVDFTLQ